MPFNKTILDNCSIFHRLRLQHLGTPVIEIKDKLSRGAPEGVEESLFLAMNSRIMLTKNLFVEASLYNGAMGKFNV